MNKLNTLALLAAIAMPFAAHAANDGEIRKVDKEAGKLTIKHGELKDIGMGPMTMVFKVKSPDMLDKVKAGDKVSFSVEQTGGALTVTAIDVVK
jgi:Cu(I)/Ag(I) efflux system protein CusF